MNKFFFVGWNSDYDEIMINSMSQYFHCSNIVLPFFLKYLFHILSKLKLNTAKQKLTYLYVKRRMSDLSQNDLIICKDTNFFCYIEAISSYPQKKVLVLRNIVSLEYYQKYSPSFDKVFSFDLAQCKSYGVNYLNQVFPFQELDIKPTSSHVEKSCFFIGMDKGRISKITYLASVIEELGYKPDFHVLRDKTSTSKSLFYVNKTKTYLENISHTLNSFALVEINQENQSGITLRTLESLFLKKKLVTNNADVKGYDFYNEKNIYVIDHEVDSDRLETFFTSELSEISNEILYKYTPKFMIEDIYRNVYSS